MKINYTVKPLFHGACFGAVSAPTLSARVSRRARGAFEKKNASTMNIAHVSMAQIAAPINVRADKLMLPDALIVCLQSQKTRGNSNFSWRLALLFDAKSARIFQ